MPTRKKKPKAETMKANKQMWWANIVVVTVHPVPARRGRGKRGEK